MSSVTLKSPRTRSGLGRRLDHLSISICAQKAGCYPCLFSTYMFSIVSSSVPDHFIFIIIALPCLRVYVITLVGAIRALFSIIVTLAVVLGLLGVLELNTSKFFPK